MRMGASLAHETDGDHIPFTECDKMTARPVDFQIIETPGERLRTRSSDPEVQDQSARPRKRQRAAGALDLHTPGTRHPWSSSGQPSARLIAAAKETGGKIAARFRVSKAEISPCTPST
jgi:phytoene dehydrogenase-like protein